jgi:hypothetical protein
MEQKKSERILSMLHAEIEKLESAHLRDQVLKGLIAPACERRTFQSDRGDAKGDLWIFFIVPGRDVALAYSDEGYAIVDARWGLVFVHDEQYGSSGNWVSSLEGLLKDSGYFEIE